MLQSIKNRKIKAAIVVITIAALFFSGYFYSSFRRGIDENLQAMIGEEAVKCLYNFRSVEQLSEQMNQLYKITTEPVYNQLTIDNEERTLNTYLKFKNKPTFVKIHKSTSHYVIYSLKNENIDSERRFIFLFSVNEHNKIDDVREVEGIDFIEVSD